MSCQIFKTNSMKNIILFSFLVLVLFACKKEKTVNDDYLAFGMAYNYCVGNCAHFFLISGNKLYPDDMERYGAEPLKFKQTALSNDKYILGKQLLDNFPQYLKNNPDSVFGCPDCHDQGGYHLQLKQGSNVINWHIDADTAYQPAAIRNYIEALKATLAKL